MTQVPPGQAAPPPPPVQLAGAGKSRALSITALVLGICALVPVLGIALGLAAIIIGIVALATKRPGKGMAITGLVLGGVAPTMTTALLVAILLPALGRAMELARRSVCAANLSSIGKAVLIYQAEHEAMPPDMETLIRSGTSPKAFDCPSADKGRASDYFLLLPKAGAQPDPSETIIACDYKGNHSEGRNVLYLDGHVAWLSESAFQQELAKPSNAAFAAALKKAEGP